jgi:glycosyltransferase involved in cell wall biosynthesis
MTECLLSIITVTFNDKKNFVKTCRSLSSQTLRTGWEHVVIDGKSTDGTADWYFSEAPVINFKLVSETDSGIFDAMNKGLAASSGDYVCFLNAGDVLPDTETLDFIYRKLANSRPTWAYGMARVVDESGNQVRKNVGSTHYSRRSHLLSRSVICHQAVWMSRGLIEKLGGFEEGFGSAGDYHLLIRAGAIAPPAVWDRVVVNFATGGVSDVGVYRHLWRRHYVRVEVGDYGRPLAAADAVWTVGQLTYVRVRKLAKHAVLFQKDTRRRPKFSLRGKHDSD